MDLRKKIDNDTVVAARYLSEPDGLSLGIYKKGGRFINMVAAIELVDGRPTLTINRDVVAHYGIVVREADSGITEW